VADRKNDRRKDERDPVTGLFPDPLSRLPFGRQHAFVGFGSKSGKIQVPARER
jgi:hypothetical protein